MVWGREELSFVAVFLGGVKTCKGHCCNALGRVMTLQVPLLQNFGWGENVASAIVAVFLEGQANASAKTLQLRRAGNTPKPKHCNVSRAENQRLQTIAFALVAIFIRSKAWQQCFGLSQNIASPLFPRGRYPNFANPTVSPWFLPWCSHCCNGLPVQKTLQYATPGNRHVASLPVLEMAPNREIAKHTA
jgi:hypothetical protein